MVICNTGLINSHEVPCGWPCTRWPSSLGGGGYLLTRTNHVVPSYVFPHKGVREWNCLVNRWKQKQKEPVQQNWAIVATFNILICKVRWCPPYSVLGDWHKDSWKRGVIYSRHSRSSYSHWHHWLSPWREPWSYSVRSPQAWVPHQYPKPQRLLEELLVLHRGWKPGNDVSNTSKESAAARTDKIR